MATSLERGTAFEVQLHALFEAHGYRALHNVRLTGRSGAEHQVDVYAELELPLQVVRVIVEAKAREEAVDKEALLKLSQIVDDLGADRGILATTGGFGPGALRIAEGRNVDLWDRDRVLRLLGEVALGLPAQGAEAAAGPGPALGRPPGAGPRQIRARVTPDEARAAVEAAIGRRRRGGVFRVGRIDERLVSLERVQRTLYEVTLDVAGVTEERRGLLSRELVHTIAPVQLTVDAATGEIVTVDVAGRIVPAGPALPELTPEEAEAVRELGGEPFSRDDLLGRGLRPAKARQLVATLQAKGLLESEPGEGGRLAYRITAAAPDVAGRVSVGASFRLEPLRGEPAAALPGARSQAGVVRALEALVPHSSVRSLVVVYAPLYAYELQRPDGSRRRELIDGLTGETRLP